MDTPHRILVDGQEVEWQLVRSPTAKKLRIKVGPDGVKVVLPEGRNIREAAAFVADNRDCDDQNPSIFPGADEYCDGDDDDCDGEVDDGFGEETCGVGQCQVEPDIEGKELLSVRTVLHLRQQAGRLRQRG